MLSQTGIYALQAVLHLGQQANGTPVSASAMAEALSIPGNYLAKTLHRLAREGILDSVRGAGGGYRLAVPADVLPVARVVEPFQDFRSPGICLMGGGRCDPNDPCPAHARWSQWTGATLGMLERTTVADLLGPDHETDDTENSERER